MIGVLPNIVLVGFMGCGKTSVGRRLASLTGHRLVDTDDMVAGEAGVSIPEIFSEEGEEGFRRRESDALASLEGVCGIVVSTGGGIILSAGNRERLRALGVVAWIHSKPDVLFERATRSGRRPLLQTGDPRARFDALLDSRLAFYEAASDFCIDSTGLNHEQAAAAILENALRCHRGAPTCGDD